MAMIKAGLFVCAYKKMVDQFQPLHPAAPPLPPGYASTPSPDLYSFGCISVLVSFESREKGSIRTLLQFPGTGAPSSCYCHGGK